MPIDTSIRLGPYKSSLQATIGLYGLSVNSGNYTTAVKKFLL